MSLFLKKNKKIIIDCFTYSHDVYEYAKIEHAIKYVPDWWKETLAVYNEKLTVKKCPAFLNFFKRGLVIPSWFELEISISKKEEKIWKWECSSVYFDMTDSHDSTQFEKFAGPDGQNFKFTSPWVFRTKEDVDFLWSQPTWNMRENLFKFCNLPAVVNFKDQNSTNINYFFEYKEEETFIKIEPLTPLVVLHPLSEREIEIRNHLVSTGEFNNIRTGIRNFFFSRNIQDTLMKEKKKLSILKKIQELKD
jgi:hypothetical protein